MRMTRTVSGAIVALCVACMASGQATSSSLVVKVIAEVETRVMQDGREIVRLMPASRVVPGDEVIYTLEIRNSGAAPVAEPTVINPVPAHMAYLADSATGPGAEVSYSIEGGHSFDWPENLRMVGADGSSRLAKPADYTHIRWTLKNTLRVNSVAFARFRAVVK
jgi:uncharacterized repeat protein (TIGR01451 family)